MFLVKLDTDKGNKERYKAKAAEKLTSRRRRRVLLIDLLLADTNIRFTAGVPATGRASINVATYIGALVLL